MEYKVEFFHGAETDLTDITNWYAQFNAELVDDFLNRLDAALETIRANPLRFQKIYKNYRKLNLSRFPYKLIYRIEDQTIVVIAISNHKRDQGYWKRRK
jgi:plasmid stabilization system protein ParE